MPITKVDGRRFLETGTIIVTGSEPVIEIKIDRDEFQHEVAIKFRHDDDASRVKFGNPSDNRTVVHFSNFHPGSYVHSDGEPIGFIGDYELRLAFQVEPLTSLGVLRKLTFTLYADAVAK